MGANEDVQTTESGLQYIVMEPGEGDSPVAADSVEVHYEGRAGQMIGPKATLLFGVELISVVKADTGAEESTVMRLRSGSRPSAIKKRPPGAFLLLVARCFPAFDSPVRAPYLSR